MPAAVLDSVFDAIRDYAKRKSISIITGTIDPDMALPTITYGGGPGDTARAPDAPRRMEEFLATIEAFACRVIVVAVMRVDADDWESAQSAWAAAELEFGANYPSVISHGKAVMADAGDPTGEIAEIDIGVLTNDPALLIRYRDRAPWYLPVMDADSLIDELRESVSEAAGNEGRAERDARARQIEETYRAQEAERRKWSGAKRHEIVAQLANHPDFPKAKKEAARIFLFSRLVGDEMPDDREIARLITREALAMYELEIKPTK